MPARRPLRLISNNEAMDDLPIGNVTIWSAEEANAIAEQVHAMHGEWTTVLASCGLPQFLLGAKYDFVCANGTVHHDVVHHAHSTAGRRRTELLWRAFGKSTFEPLRRRLEAVLKAPVRIHAEAAHWPPTFIVHLPHAVWSHPGSGDMHVDCEDTSNLPTQVQAAVETVVRARDGWGSGQCAWDAQVSVLVALAVPSTGANITFAVQQPGGALEERTLPHNVGKAVLIEAGRPHLVSAFTGRTSSVKRSLDDARMVLHAFLVPCWSAPEGGADENGNLRQLELQLIGPIGGGAQCPSDIRELRRDPVRWESELFLCDAPMATLRR